MRPTTFIPLLLGAMLLGIQAGNATSAAEVTRTVLEKHDQSGETNKEVVSGRAIFPAGGSIGFHTHPGDEAGYVMTGSIVLKTKGQPDRTIVAGNSFFNPRGAVHSVEAGPEGATIVSTWIVDKGVPMATPVQ